MSTDRGKITLLALGILLLAALGVYLSRAVSARLLRRDAQATARNWAMSLAGSGRRSSRHHCRGYTLRCNAESSR